MALQLSHTTNQGFSAATAYARISEIRVLHKDTDTMLISVDIFYDQAARDNGDLPMDTVVIVRGYDDTISESFADYYTYLKTTAEFTGAADVL